MEDTSENSVHKECASNATDNQPVNRGRCLADTLPPVSLLGVSSLHDFRAAKDVATGLNRSKSRQTVSTVSIVTPLEFSQCALLTNAPQKRLLLPQEREKERVLLTLAQRGRPEMMKKTNCVKSCDINRVIKAEKSKTSCDGAQKNTNECLSRRSHPDALPPFSLRGVSSMHDFRAAKDMATGFNRSQSTQTVSTTSMLTPLEFSQCILLTNAPEKRLLLPKETAKKIEVLCTLGQRARPEMTMKNSVKSSDTNGAKNVTECQGSNVTAMVDGREEVAIKEAKEEKAENQQVKHSAAGITIKKTHAERRVTLASISPLTDYPKCASEIEQEGILKIRQWKGDFAEKLNKMLGERYKKPEEKQKVKPKGNPKVFKVPTNLSEEEKSSMRFNLIHELKKKSKGLSGEGGVLTDASAAPTHHPPPIPRVRFPRKPTADQSPASLREQMMKELSTCVSVITDTESGETQCLKPTALAPHISKGSASQPQRNAPTRPKDRILDTGNVRDLLSWHEVERESLRTELGRLPSTKEGQRVLIDLEDANKILQSMSKVTQDIYNGTIERLRGVAAEPETDVTSNEEDGTFVAKQRGRPVITCKPGIALEGDEDDFSNVSSESTLTEVSTSSDIDIKSCIVEDALYVPPNTKVPSSDSILQGSKEKENLAIGETMLTASAVSTREQSLEEPSDFVSNNAASDIKSSFAKAADENKSDTVSMTKKKELCVDTLGQSYVANLLRLSQSTYTDTVDLQDEEAIELQSLQGKLKAHKEYASTGEDIAVLSPDLNVITPSRTGLQQEVDNLSMIIHQRDQEITRLLENNLRNEELLRDLRDKLNGTVSKNGRLQGLQRSEDEEKQQVLLKGGEASEQKLSSNSDLGNEIYEGKLQVRDREELDTITLHWSKEKTLNNGATEIKPTEEATAQMSHPCLLRSPKATKPAYTPYLEGFVERGVGLQKGADEICSANHDTPIPKVDQGQKSSNGKNESVQGSLNAVIDQAKLELQQEFRKVFCDEDMDGEDLQKNEESKTEGTSKGKKGEAYTRISVTSGCYFLDENHVNRASQISLLPSVSSNSNNADVTMAVSPLNERCNVIVNPRSKTSLTQRKKWTAAHRGAKQPHNDTNHRQTVPKQNEHLMAPFDEELGFFVAQTNAAHMKAEMAQLALRSVVDPIQMNLQITDDDSDIKLSTDDEDESLVDLEEKPESLQEEFRNAKLSGRTVSIRSSQKDCVYPIHRCMGTLMPGLVNKESLDQKASGHEPKNLSHDQQDEKVMEAAQCFSAGDRLKDGTYDVYSDISTASRVPILSNTQSASSFTSGFCAEFLRQKRNFSVGDYNSGNSTNSSIWTQDKARCETRCTDMYGTESQISEEKDSNTLNHQPEVRRNSRFDLWLRNVIGFHNLIEEDAYGFVTFRESKRTEDTTVNAREQKKPRKKADRYSASAEFSRGNSCKSDKTRFADYIQEKNNVQGERSCAKTSTSGHLAERHWPADETGTLTESRDDSMDPNDSESNVSSSSVLATLTDTNIRGRKTSDAIHNIYRAIRVILRANESKKKDIQECLDKVHFVSEEVTNLRERNTEMRSDSHVEWLTGETFTWTERNTYSATESIQSCS